MNEVGVQSGLKLSSLVCRFRRAARLLAVDPLRCLPTDSLTPLLEKSAPLERLLATEPFERLRQALVPKPEAARDATPPTRARRPVPPAPGIAPSTGRALGSPPPGVPGTAAGTARFGSPAPSTTLPSRDASLAQRRARLRHQADATSTEPRRSSASVAAAPGLSAARPASASAGTRDIAAHEELQLARAARAEAPLAQRLAARRAAARAAPVEAGAGAGAGPVSRSALAPPLLGSPELAPAPSASARAEEVSLEASLPAGNEASLGARAQRVAHSQPPDASARPTLMERARPTGAEARSSASRTSSVEGLRDWDPHAGLEQDDTLFETLYREGVDLSWP